MFIEELRDYVIAQNKASAPIKPKMTLDSAKSAESAGEFSGNSAARFQEQAIASEALNLLSEWLETDDLDDGEGLGDRLMNMMVGLADDNKDGEISDDEAEVINIGLNAVADYLVEKGISEENASALLEEFDNDLAENVREALLAAVPDGEEFDEELDNFVFSEEENAPLLDSAAENVLAKMAKAQNLTLDAAYRKVFAVRNGRKLRINKRISGKVRLSAKQRQAIRKAQRKSHTGAAMMRRMKSFKMRRRMGL